MNIYDLKKLVKENNISIGKYYRLDTGEVFKGISRNRVNFEYNDTSKLKTESKNNIGDILEDTETINLIYDRLKPSITAKLISLLGFTTDDLEEGTTHLYFTSDRVNNNTIHPFLLMGT